MDCFCFALVKVSNQLATHAEVAEIPVAQLGVALLASPGDRAIKHLASEPPLRLVRLRNNMIDAFGWISAVSAYRFISELEVRQHS